MYFSISFGIFSFTEKSQHVHTKNTLCKTKEGIPLKSGLVEN